MKNYKAITVAVLCIVVLGMILLKSQKSQKNNNQLVVGMMSGWAPFMVINGEGQYEGFDVDVAYEIGRRLDKEVVIKDLGSLASCFVALEQGKIDILMSGLDITEKRRNAFNMIYYTGEDVQEYALVFWKEIPTSIKTMSDLQAFSNTVICVESGSSQEKFLDNYDFIVKKRMNSVIDIILDLRFGKSLAAVIEPRIAARLKKQNPELQLLPVELPQEFKVFGCGIAIKKDNTTLARSVESAVRSMIQDGTIKKLEIKWQLQE